MLLWAVVLAGRLEEPCAVACDAEPITLLKPLHGTEPRLAANLSSVLDQHYAAPVQLLFGVHRDDDPAIAVVGALRESRSDADIALVIDGRSHGANAKVSNLINLHRAARHDVIVISDSDIAVDPHYLGRLVAALARPGVGAVSCLYRGRANAGVWSALSAMGIDLHFLPATLIGMDSGLAHPCMGSTIALRAETLARIGGFEAVSDILADDYAIGEAVRALGLTVAIPDVLVTHGCSEPSLAALVHHELRWNATVAGIDPAGFAGSVVLHSLAWALLAMAALGLAPPPVTATALALCARFAMAWRLDRRPTARMALIPIRDLLSFALFLATFFVRSVDWRGSKLRVDGKTIARSEAI